MIKKSYLIFIFVFLFCLAIVLSEVQTLGTFKSDSCINLKQLGTGFDNCTLTTVQQPNSSVYIINSLMTKDDVEYNYTFCNTESIGSYIANGFCSETGGGGDTAWNYNFEITKTGEGTVNPITIALVIGVSLIVGLFIFLTFAVKDDKPFLANFFFLGIFVFATVLSNLIWKITYVNSAPYEPIMLAIYRIMLIITMLMFLIILVMLTVEVVQVRKIAGNPVDNYRDNLGKNE